MSALLMDLLATGQTLIHYVIHVAKNIVRSAITLMLKAGLSKRHWVRMCGKERACMLFALGHGNPGNARGGKCNNRVVFDKPAAGWSEPPPLSLPELPHLAHSALH